MAGANPRDRSGLGGRTVLVDVNIDADPGLGAAPGPKRGGEHEREVCELKPIEGDEYEPRLVEGTNEREALKFEEELEATGVGSACIDDDRSK